MKTKNFCAFILTFGRADHVITYDSLINAGYTGRIIIVCSDDDKQIDKYKKNFKEVVVFNKNESAKHFDLMDNFKEQRTIVFARNECFRIAKRLGIDYFIQLDDDYTIFEFAAYNKTYIGHKSIKDINPVLDLMCDFITTTPFSTVAMGQGGDYIGGSNCGIMKKYVNNEIPRKAMNTFVCKTDKPFNFIGRINEDVNAYSAHATKGMLFCTLAQLRIEQKQTQINEGGMSGSYNALGTYVKSFYSIIAAPSCVKIMMMGFKNKRIHHSVSWNNCTPKILSEKYKRGN